VGSISHVKSFVVAELYRVILHFRSNFDTKPDRVMVENYIAKYLEAMQGIGQVVDVEVVNLLQVQDVPTDAKTARTTLPPPSTGPEIIVEEPDTGKRTKLPGTGQ
jgi:hypothetical protein